MRALGWKLGVALEPLIIIPTYWWGKYFQKRSVFAVYDHPTFLEGEETLSRTLLSLRKLKGSFKVVVIGTVIELHLKGRFQKKLREILKKFRDLNLTFFSFNELDLVCNRLRELGKDKLIPYLSLEGYSNIRNLGLLIGAVLGVDSLLMLDDDEVVLEEDFLEKAFEFVGSFYEGKEVLGKTGYYLKDEKGNYLGSDQVLWWDVFWRKGWAMNQVLKTIGTSPRLKETSFALGGAMVIHKKLFEKIPFDPYIVRGEDIDYLINTKMEGYNFFLDSKFSVLHLPPPSSNPVLGMRQDIYRFFYEAKKLEYAKKLGKQISLSELDPYPGFFLRKDVRRRALISCFLQALRDIRKPEFLGHLKNVKTALYDAKIFARKNYYKYFSFVHKWHELLKTLEKDRVLKDYFWKGNL